MEAADKHEAMVERVMEDKAHLKMKATAPKTTAVKATTAMDKPCRSLCRRLILRTGGRDLDRRE